MSCDCKNVNSDLSLIEETLQKYASDEGNLITILQNAQEIYGYLPVDVIYHVAERVGVSPARVMGVATFYAQFSLKPIGKYLVMLCQGTACHVNGSERILRAISEELGIADGETTDDGLFTIKCVACLGCCSLSPVMMINDDTYGSLTPEKAVSIVRALKAKEA
ncbi:MAG: NADH-quinone oxidoreductase subunit NuoE [Clostridia bacterium]|nr:NADH-quinone oxidoreductase subunit NuoE [Clostridia bacterium]